VTSPPCTDACPDWHSQLASPEELARRVQMAAAWQRLKDSFSHLTLIQLSAGAASASVACLILDHPDFIGHVKRDLQKDTRHLIHVRRLQEWHRDLDVPGDPHRQDHQKALDLLGPDAVRRADTTEALLRLIIKPGIELANAERNSGETEFLRLTAEAVDHDRRSRQFQVQVPTLNHQPTRDRLHLAGHPSERKLLGYGRNHRLEHVEESAEPEPQRAGDVTERNRRDKSAQSRRRALSAASKSKPRGRRVR